MVRDLNTFQMLLQSMVTNLSTTQFQEAGLVNKFQEENLRDQIQVLMMKVS
jgi:hypothetical protein